MSKAFSNRDPGTAPSGEQDWLAPAAALIESAPVAMYQTDGEGNRVYANPEYRRVFGLGVEQGADDWLQGVHPDDRARMERSWADFRTHPCPMIFEYRTAPQDGVVRHYTEQVVPVNGMAAFVGTITDVTDLASENRTLLETLMANLPLSLIACDADGVITLYNRAAAELLSMQSDNSSAGKTCEHVVGAQIYHADGVTPLDLADRPLVKALRGELVDDVELVVVPRDSTERVTVTNGRRLTAPDGRALGAFIVTEDITERRRSELELERVHEQLRTSARQAGMAEVATSILHNVGNVLTSIHVAATMVQDGLERSKASDLCEMAELLLAQGARLGEFMTHDERGKIVPAYLQALGQQLTAETEAALEHMATLRKSLEHVDSAVAMQQKFARVASMRETVSVVDLVEDSLRLSASAFNRHGIELRREFHPLPAITVDKHKVLQILVNLIHNAMNACNESDRKDKVLRLRIEGGDPLIRISVSDNGVGIAPENMGRLFTHGFTTRPKGHGFGLHSGAIAARELGGSLRAESAGAGRGATFILELPRDPPA
ncbi:MAG: PAS domain-containing protein [Proteobacteria bacterium]|nr:PAS domain-containing protein [Pseudomonadota bacterium]